MPIGIFTAIVRPFENLERCILTYRPAEIPHFSVHFNGKCFFRQTFADTFGNLLTRDIPIKLFLIPIWECDLYFAHESKKNRTTVRLKVKVSHMKDKALCCFSSLHFFFVIVGSIGL